MTNSKFRLCGHISPDKQTNHLFYSKNTKQKRTNEHCYSSLIFPHVLCVLSPGEKRLAPPRREKTGRVAAQRSGGFSRNVQPQTDPRGDPEACSVTLRCRHFLTIRASCRCAATIILEKLKRVFVDSFLQMVFFKSQ